MIYIKIKLAMPIFPDSSVFVCIHDKSQYVEI